MISNNTPSAETVANLAILTKPQTAQLLSCTVRSIERQIKAGRLRACKISHKFVRLRRDDIDRFLDSYAIDLKTLALGAGESMPSTDN